MVYSDRELLARIVQREAEGDNGMKAVATVTQLVNREIGTPIVYALII